MSTKKIMLVVVLIAAAGAGIYAWKEYNRKNPDLSGATAVYTVQAHTLIAEFNTNDSAANSRYLGKIVEVQGMVKQVDRDDEGHCTVVLGDTADMSSVRCAMDSAYADRAAALQPGEPVTIKGAFTGFKKDETGLLGSDVELNRCVIQKN
jgi:hypothetical protein